MSQLKDFQVGADSDPLTVAGTFTAQGAVRLSALDLGSIT